MALSRRNAVCTNSFGTLLCPQCGGDNLHQVGCEVWFRTTEDSDQGLHIKAHQHLSMGVDNSMTGNPSSRRDGIQITFNCEHCPVISSLNITQHKGCTYLEWEAIEKAI